MEKAAMFIFKKLFIEKQLVKFSHLKINFYIIIKYKTGMKNFIKYGARTLISANRDYSIKVRDLVTGKLFKTLIGHSKEITCLKLLKHDLLASGSHDCTIKIWSLLEERCLITLYGHNNTISCLEQLPNEFLISASQQDKSIIIWDIMNRNCVNLIDDESVSLKALTNNLFASTSGEKLIKIWDYTTGKIIKTLIESPKYLARLEITTHNQLVSCMEDKTLSIMSLEDGIRINFLDGHPDFLTCLKLNNQGQLVIINFYFHFMRFLCNKDYKKIFIKRL
jgi:WD40 repeat protein